MTLAKALILLATLALIVVAVVYFIGGRTGKRRR